MNKDEIKRFGAGVYTAWRWFVWGLRWLAIVVFGVLFFVGLSVRLPWKVLACLAIVPIVGIFVPKKVQPWVWVGLTLVVAGLWLWVRLPGRDSGQWRVYQFEDAAQQLQSRRLIVPEDNAAIRYEALLSRYGESIFYHPPFDEATDYALYHTAWTHDEYPVMAEWLGGFHTGIETLLEIARLEDCQFATPYNFVETGGQMNRLNRMKGWARLLLWSANLDLGQGRTERALEKKRAVLQMARHLYQQQTLFDHSAAFDIELLGFRDLGVFMIDHCRQPDTLKAIERDFAAIDTGWAKSWVQIVEREKLIVNNLMGSFYEVNDNGRVRIAHGAMFALQEGLGYEPRKLFFNQHEMNRLAVIGLWLSLPTKPDGVAALVDRRFDYYSLEVQKGAPLPAIPIQYSWRMGLNIRSLIDWLAMDKMKYFWALNGQHRRHEAMLELISLFSALKQYRLEHGRWPADLGMLVPAYFEMLSFDPVSNRPFVYRLEDDGFRLYSVGANGVDDHGVNNPQEQKDDIVFWPRMPEPDKLEAISPQTERPL